MNSTRMREVAAALRTNSRWWAPAQRPTPAGIGEAADAPEGTSRGDFIAHDGAWHGVGVLFADALQPSGVAGVAARFVTRKICPARDATFRWLGDDAEAAVRDAARTWLEVTEAEADRLFAADWFRKAGVRAAGIENAHAAAAVLEAIADGRIVIDRARVAA